MIYVFGGFPIALAVFWIPLINVMVISLVEMYCMAGLVMLILAYTKVLK